MIELERQMHEAELEQQALAAAASKQRIDMMDKIRMVTNAMLLLRNVWLSTGN